MHDTYLLNKISKSLKDICHESKIEKINQFTLAVNHNSHINEENLREHLKNNNSELIGNALKINVVREDIEDHTAIIHSIQGESLES